MPLAVKEALYRIAQEALHNVVKHARAGKVALRLARSDGALALELSDDGVGFDPDGEFPGHLGLRSMRERVVALGGDLVIRARPAAGRAPWHASLSAKQRARGRQQTLRYCLIRR